MYWYDYPQQYECDYKLISTVIMGIMRFSIIIHVMSIKNIVDIAYCLLLLIVDIAYFPAEGPRGGGARRGARGWGGSPKWFPL